MTPDDAGGEISKTVDSSFLLKLSLGFLVAVLVRLVGLGANSFWLDEMTSRQVALADFGDILGCRAFDCHTPPFYYLVLHYWLKLVPATEVGLRLFSVLIDALNAVLVGVLAMRLFGKRVVGAAMFLYVSSSFCIYYAQEARMYPLLTFLSLLAFVLTQSFLAKRRFSLLLLVSGVFGAGLYTHYYFFLVLAGLTAGVILECYNRKDWKTLFWWCLTLAIAGVLFLPWLGVLFSLVSGGKQDFRHFTKLAIPYTCFRFLAGYGLLPLNYGTKARIGEVLLRESYWAVPFFLVFGVAFLSSIKQSWQTPGLQAVRGGRLLLFSSAFVPLILAGVASQISNFVSERYLCFLLPFYILMLAHWICSAPNAIGWQKMIRVGVLVFWLMASAFHYLNPQAGFAQWREAVHQIVERERDSRVADLPLIIVNPDYIGGLVEYYLGQEEPELLKRLVKHSLPKGVGKSSELDSNSETGSQSDNNEIKMREIYGADAQRVYLVENAGDLSAEPSLNGLGFDTRSRTLFCKENGIWVTELAK